MKRFYLLCLLSPLLILTPGFTQPFDISADQLSGIPEFKPLYLVQHGVQSIRINTIRQQRPGVQIIESSLVQTFNESGNLTREIEVTDSDQSGTNMDTSRIASFFYNDKGALGWKQETDVRWGKVYRTGYRFNENNKKYQIRDYEMLANEQVMLLETKQYLYDNESGSLVGIRFRRGSEVLRVHRFEYDDMGRIVKETRENANQEIVFTVTYEYYENGSISKIVEQVRDLPVRSYAFSYDDRGFPQTIDWTDEEGESGTFAYQYDEEGLLIAMETTSSREPVLRRSFQYERPQQTATDALAER